MAPPSTPRSPSDAAAGARRTLVQVALVVAVMGGLSFAAVPFYDLFCRVTGFAGTPARASVAPGAVDGRTIRVFFDANTHRDLPWRFEPVQQSLDVKFGEPAVAFYRAHNPTDKPIVGTASFNVAPPDLGGYFSKIECFCFTEQVLKPGQTVMMPVTFFVDPELLEDAERHEQQTITLSYTFFKAKDQSAAETLRTEQTGDAGAKSVDGAPHKTAANTN